MAPSFARWWLRLAPIFVIGLTAWHVADLGDERLDVWVSDLAWIIAPATSALLLVRNVRQTKAVGASTVTIKLILCAPVCWTIANSIWAYYELVLNRAVPSPSPADVFYTAALLAAVAAGVVRLSSVVGRASGLRSLLDGLVLGGSIVWILWSLFFQATESGSMIWVYPVLGVAAGSLCVVVMSRVPPRNRVGWLVLGAAFLLHAVADSAWAYYEAVGVVAGGHLVDVLWVVAYLLVGGAALATRQPGVWSPARTLQSYWEVVLPYPFAMVAIVLAATRYETLSAMGVVSIVSIAGLMLVRQLLALVENGQLTRTLEARVAARTEELHQREAHFRTLVQGISEVLLILGPRAEVTYLSPSAERILGFTMEHFAGSTIAELVHPDDVESVRRNWADLSRADGSTATVLLRCRRVDGSWCSMEARAVDMRHEPAVGGIVVTLRDVGERVALEARLRHQAYHDALTGLANRRRLQELLDDAVHGQTVPSLVLLDLDEFKAVNDASGHELGDEVLVAVAERLRRCTRPGDLVARLGGDEFAVLVADDADGAIAASLAGRVLAELSVPLVRGGRELRCGASLGVATSRGGSGVDLVRDADVAMYVAKRRGRGRAEVFTQDMHDAVLWRRGMEDRLRAAIVGDGLVLHYQPVVALATGTVVGVEALVRLPDGAGGPIPPAAFIPIAEETGLVVALGAWVLRQACADAAGWQAVRPDGPPLQVSVNLSTRQLQEPDLRATVSAALDAAGLHPGLLTLEITEGALDGDDLEAETMLLALRDLGVRLSVDDFGTGYSSLGRLRTMPVDEVKIDRSFVAELDGDAEAPLVEVILGLGERLGLAVVAEGLETPAQARALVDRGGTLAQGYLYARPAPADQVPGWLVTDLRPSHSTSVVEPL